MKCKNRLLLIMALVVSVFFGCSNDTNIDEYKIGAILPLTGTGAEDGEFQKQGIDLAVAKINKAGGVNGKLLKIIYEDSQNQAKMGISALNTILQRYKTPVVLSTMSGVSAPLASYAGGKVPAVLFVTVASVPKITRHGDNIFRAFVTSDVESHAIAEFMYKQGFRNMAVLYVNDDYGLGGKTEFYNEFERLGGNVVADEAYEKGTTNYRNLVVKTLAKKPDAVFVVGYDKSFALLVQQLGQMPDKVQLVTTSPLSVPSWRKLAGDAADGTYLANSWFRANPDDPVTREFDDAYRAAYGKPSNYLSAAAYTSVMMIAEAIRTGGYSKEGIQQALGKINNMSTLLGELSMSSEREAAFPVRMAQLIGGKVVNLE